MRQLLIFAILGIVLIGCDYGITPNYQKTIPSGNRAIESIEFDECEYVYLRRMGSVAITHKGNCKNPIHKP